MNGNQWLSGKEGKVVHGMHAYICVKNTCKEINYLKAG